MKEQEEQEFKDVEARAAWARAKKMLRTATFGFGTNATYPYLWLDSIPKYLGNIELIEELTIDSSLSMSCWFRRRWPLSGKMKPKARNNHNHFISNFRLRFRELDQVSLTYSVEPLCEVVNSRTKLV